MRPERRIKPGVDGGLRAASWVSLATPFKNGGAAPRSRLAILSRFGLMEIWGAEQVSDRQPRVRKPATERLINLALGPNRTSQSVHQLVSDNLRTLDGRGRDLRVSGGV
jgi:hypothetical protein